jgi:predicted DCC family thiol-disulfide oxidoreductase YuxK
MAIAEPVQAEPKPLPTPAERPQADVVIFDGDCRMCTAQIRALTWWDCQGRLSYLSLHDPEVARRYPDLTHEMLMNQMYVVDQQGNRYGGAAAIRYLSRRLRRLWWLAPLLHIPGSLPLWQWLYQQVAKRRYRFGKLNQCDNDACSLHGR